MDHMHKFFIRIFMFLEEDWMICQFQMNYGNSH